MGRPRDYSYRSYQLIYARLLKGPLWLEDWKSTGLKSRSTVDKRLEYLASKGLVKRGGAGHKKPYEIAPLKNEKGTITNEGISWQGLLHPTSRKEKRQIKSRLRKTVKKMMEMEKQHSLFCSAIWKILEENDKIIEHPKSQEVYDALKEAGIDWERIPIHTLLRFLLHPHLEDQLCINCLRNKEVSYYVTDPNTGEVVCPKCGIVVREEPFELVKHSRERPSPFPPASEEEDK